MSIALSQLLTGVAVASLLLARPVPAAESYVYFAEKNANPRPARDLTFVGQDGRPYSLSELRGKYVLLAFGFTNCPNVCPTTLAELSVIYELLTPAEQKQVQVLFVSVDPSRDTADVLKEYVPRFDRHFIGLTGTPKQIAEATVAFGAEYEQTRERGGDAANYTMDHSAGALLLGRDGRWIASYRIQKLRQSQKVAEDLRHFISSPDVTKGQWESEKGGVARTPILSGRELYLQECASCHGPEGAGVPGKYPALAGSTWVLGAPNRLTALTWNGLRGEGGATMPGWWRILPPEGMASLLTYIRDAWGNNAPAISTPYARTVGYRFARRSDFWSAKELRDLLPDTAEEAAAGQ